MTNSLSKLVDPWWRPFIYLIGATILFVAVASLDVDNSIKQLFLYLIGVTTLMVVMSILYHLFHKQWLQAVFSILGLGAFVIAVFIFLGTTNNSFLGDGNEPLPSEEVELIEDLE